MSEEAAKKVRLEVLPIRQKQPGFIDLIAQRDDNDQQRLVFLSFWNQRKVPSSGGLDCPSIAAGRATCRNTRCHFCLIQR